jgi:hypothetical protein
MQAGLAGSDGEVCLSNDCRVLALLLGAPTYKDGAQALRRNDGILTGIIA